MIKCRKVLGIICVVFLTFLTLSFFEAIIYADENSNGTVNASDVNLRSGPGKTYKVIGKLQKGDSIKILDNNGDWYKVNTSKDSTGWISKKYVSLNKATDTSAGTLTTSPTGTVNASDVNLRSGPGKTYKVIGKLQKGNSIKILDNNGDWYKVNTSEGSIGWASKKYISLTQDETSKDNTRTAVSRGGTRTSSESNDVVNYAKQYLNVRYVWGGNGPSGFDCSGFVKYVYKKFGIELNRVANDQAKEGTYVNKKDLIAGDLVFFDTNGGHKYINHSGIYIGDGKFIHASSGKGKVAICDLTTGYYLNNYITARRVSK